MSADQYSPEPIRRERNFKTKTMGESTHYQTRADDSLASILNRLVLEFRFPRFWFETQRALPIPGEYDSKGRPVVYWPDSIVHGSLFGDGVFRVQGGIHGTRKHQLRDPVQKERMERIGYWVCDLTNLEAKDEPKVRKVLETHRRKVDDYGGRA